MPFIGYFTLEDSISARQLKIASRILSIGVTRMILVYREIRAVPEGELPWREGDKPILFTPEFAGWRRVEGDWNDLIYTISMQYENPIVAQIEPILLSRRQRVYRIEGKRGGRQDRQWFLCRDNTKYNGRPPHNYP